MGSCMNSLFVGSQVICYIDSKITWSKALPSFNTLACKVQTILNEFIVNACRFSAESKGTLHILKLIQ
jgi:hypothetical protein